MNREVTTFIDKAFCNGCGLCIKVCPKDVISMQAEKAVVSGEESINCGHCFAVCPAGAITVKSLDPRQSSFNTFHSKDSWLPYGEGNIVDIVNLMQSRRSCRNFEEGAVPRDILEDLVKIGISAPSGSNSQMWTFTVLPDRECVMELGRLVGDFYKKINRMAERLWLRKCLKLLGKSELDDYYRNHYNTVKQGLERWENQGEDLLFHGATAAIIVGSKKQASCPAEDTALATQNILLAAHVLGLGTCLIGFVIHAIRRDRKIEKSIGMGEDEDAYTVIALGYPQERYKRVSGRMEPILRYFNA